MKAVRYRDKEKIAHSFLRGRSTYDSHASIQHKVSQNLVDKLALYSEKDYRRVLEIGCCTGNLTEIVLREFAIETLFLNDLVPTFEEQVVERVAHLLDNEIIPMFGDIEELELPSRLDLVVSSSTFQWLVDLPALFDRIADALEPRGHLAFAIFGPGTLGEFKEITGIGLDYLSVESLLSCLEKRFHIEEEVSTHDQLFFNSPREILRHLQATGVGGVKKFSWTPTKLREFEKSYLHKFGGVAGVPVSYFSSHIIALKKS